jgi:Na+-transporting NADH:ubiquinone oxidoreductase subunit NqrB
MIFLNIKLAFRNLIRNKVYSFLIIGGFAIGFTACILISIYKTNLRWWVFVLAGVLTLFITLITVSWQSWRELLG